jgi:hypothetical protein
VNSGKRVKVAPAILRFTATFFGVLVVGGFLGGWRIAFSGYGFLIAFILMSPGLVTIIRIIRQNSRHVAKGSA